MIFRDRDHAGEALAERLESFRDSDAVVMGLPRGGVPVAAKIASALNLPLDVLVARKLGVPGSEEFAFGAVGPGDVLYVDEELVKQIGLSPEEVERVVETERLELKRRLDHYRDQADAIEVEGRAVLVVDDGIATGSTLKAAIQALQARKPGSIVVATPVAPPDAVSDLERMVDKVVCVSVPDALGSISQWYAQFDQTSDQEVVALMREFGPQHAAR